MSFNKNKKRKKPPGAGGRSSAVPPSSGGRCPGPVRTRQAPRGGVRAVGGLQPCPPRPGGAKQSPPQFPGLFWASFPWGSLKPAKLLLAAGGAWPLPVLGLGAGGWGLAPPQLCVELLQPRGGQRGAGRDGTTAPPPQNPPGTRSRAGTTGGGRLLHSSPPLSSPLLPPPFFFSPLSSLSSLYMFGVFVCVPQRQTRFNKPETSPSSVPFVSRALLVPLPPCPPAPNCLRK